jgi:serine phosphatase RsbU (regulator of sigma subunit)
MRQAQVTLTPLSAPQWTKLEIGVSSHKGMSVSGLYYDFFTLPNNAYGILVGEASSKGTEGFIITSIIRGMARALCHLTIKPEEFVTVLNDLLINDPMKPIFSISYLILLPEENLIKYISCGYGTLWFIPAGTEAPIKILSEHIPLGVDPKVSFREVSHPWQINDSLIISAFSEVPSVEKQESFLSEDKFRPFLMEVLHLSPQKQVEVMSRKAKVIFSRTLEERSFVLISILRNE